MTTLPHTHVQGSPFTETDAFAALSATPVPKPAALARLSAGTWNRLAEVALISSLPATFLCLLAVIVVTS